MENLWVVLPVNIGQARTIPVFGEYEDMAADNDEGGADPAHGRHHPGVGHVLVPAAEVVHRACDDVPLHSRIKCAYLNYME